MSDHDTWNMFAAAMIGGFCANPNYVLVRDEDKETSRIVQLASTFADALLAESKKREPADELDTLEAAMSTPPQPDDDGWIKWGGGLTFPVRRETYVEVRYRDCKAPKFPRQAGEFVWVHDGREDDILAYKRAG